MCSLLKFVPLVFLLVSELQAQGWVYDDRGCRTPDRGVGNCIRIKQCASMDNSIYVCCPEDPITIVGVNQNPNPTPTPLQPIDEQMPPDVTGHKNLNLLSEECGWAESDNKIRNGKNARLKEFPWMVLLSYKTVNGPKFMCGGTIINEKYVLTAAHCIVNTSFPLMMQVRVGEYNIPTKTDCEVNDRGIRKCLDPVQDVAIEEIIPHPQFTLDVIQNDIGLLRIAGINMSANNVQPICLPVNENTGNPKLNSATITGWGITDPNGDQGSPILQKVDVPIVTPEVCRNAYVMESIVRITNKNICAGDREEKDSCKGDSGGPLQAAAYVNDASRYVQQGIVSYGHRHCGQKGYPAVYTKVSYYVKWILDTMRP
ncbi:hypothetical protein JTB14_016964 [Gonioctena quinquepunctata]|nr:hypothetical protein JTB14_016964 [Gonioctena quinquepunctata]